MCSTWNSDHVDASRNSEAKALTSTFLCSVLFQSGKYLGGQIILDRLKRCQKCQIWPPSKFCITILTPRNLILQVFLHVWCGFRLRVYFISWFRFSQTYYYYYANYYLHTWQYTEIKLGRNWPFVYIIAVKLHLRFVGMKNSTSRCGRETVIRRKFGYRRLCLVLRVLDEMETCHDNFSA